MIAVFPPCQGDVILFLSIRAPQGYVMSLFLKLHEPVTLTLAPVPGTGRRGNRGVMLFENTQAVCRLTVGSNILLVGIRFIIGTKDLSHLFGKMSDIGNQLPNLIVI